MEKVPTKVRTQVQSEVPLMSKAQAPVLVKRKKEKKSDTSEHEEPLTRDEIISNIESSLSENNYKKFEETIEALKSVKVLIGVIGPSCVGKSSFINKMLGLEEDDVNAAKVGDGRTTKERKEYHHPLNPHLVFSDMVGYGTSSSRRSKEYLNNMEVKIHDFFLIFYCTTISEDDCWIIENLLELGKQCAIVRTKADEMTKRKGMSLQQCIENQKAMCKEDQEEFGISAPVEPFVISNHFPEVGEFDKLFDYIGQNLSDIKQMAITLHVHAVTDQIISQKEKLLNDRAWKAAVGMGMATGVPIPGLDIPVNTIVLKKELEFYLQSFGLYTEMLEKFPEDTRMRMKTTFEISQKGLKYYILLNIGKAPVVISAVLVQEAIEVLIPVIGSLITGSAAYAFYNNFLRSMIKKLAADARVLKELHVESVV